MSRIQLKNVRISYPSLFQKAVFEGKEGKYEATFLIPKDDVKTKKILDAAIEEILSTVSFKVGKDKYCLKDGDDNADEAYHGYWSLKASNAKRPTVINRDRSPLTEDDDVIYPGHRVNGSVDFWVQNNQFGKRLNCNLYGVQFVAEDEVLGNGPIDVMGDFDELDELDI